MGFSELKENISKAFETWKEAYSKSFFGKKIGEKNIIRAILQNTLLAYMVIMICQVIFVLMNLDTYADTFSNNSIYRLLIGNLAFATPAVCYLNALYIVVLLFPLHYKEGGLMQEITKLCFVIPNALGVVANLCDSIYVRYTDRRTTWDVFQEFSNDNNLDKIIGHEMAANWWLVAVAVIIMWALGRFYTPAKKNIDSSCARTTTIPNRLIRYYILHITLLAVMAALIVTGIRGGIGRTVRPITLSNANEYVSSPNDAAVVLNTPFTLIRTVGRTPFATKQFFEEEELASIFNPERQYTPCAQPNRKNVVIIILESFGKEYIGAYNPHRKSSLTPFLDKLIKSSKSYLYSYGNGKKSIDGMPSVLSSIPMFVTPFISSSASLNSYSSIAGELADMGYYSAFFHGAPNGSMGFLAYSKAAGFKEYYGMEEYINSPLHNGQDDFDGYWAIWDEPFLQYYAEKMNDMKEPFITSVFTASSHHPFNIPDEYKEKFRGGEGEIHKCVQYTDHALQRFFEYSSKQPWYGNTLFVITADHTNMSFDERYRNISGAMEVPVIFHLPSGEAPFEPGIDSVMIAQQIDIMPTILDYTGYDKPFVAFGKSLISTPAKESYAVNFTNETYCYYKGDYLLQYNGGDDKPFAMYDIRHDTMMKRNIFESNDVQEKMTRELKAIIQQYMNRMVEDRLICGEEKKKRDKK